MFKRLPLSIGFAIMGFTIACSSWLMRSAIAAPLLSPLQSGSLRPDVSAPLCYIQFQGNSAIDVSNVCGKAPRATPDGTPVSVSKAVAPPVFDPKVTNASTTGQCNFVDANGNPCPQK